MSYSKAPATSTIPHCPLRETVADAARQADPGIHVFEGRVCAGGKFISTDEQREAITSSFGDLCCEMEGEAIALYTTQR